MLADEMRNIAKDSRDSSVGFVKQWEKMKDKIRNLI